MAIRLPEFRQSLKQSKQSVQIDVKISCGQSWCAVGRSTGRNDDRFLHDRDKDHRQEQESKQEF